MFHANFTNRLKAYLKQIGVVEDKINEYLVTLTTPTARTPVFVEQQDLLLIAEQIYQDQAIRQLCATSTPLVYEDLPRRLQTMIQQHWEKYHYTKFIFVEGEYTINDYLRQLQDILRGETAPRAIIEGQIEALQAAEEKKRILLAQLPVAPEWQEIFAVFGDFMVTKIYRRYAQLFALHRMDKVLKEIARRKQLSLKQVKFMLKSEVERLLLKNSCDPELLRERAKQCVYYVEKDGEAVYVGPAAEALIAKTVRTIDASISELKGEVGCTGYAQGRVKIVIRAEEMAKMNDGDILVSIATDPDIVPAMKKAAAIVTEQGGVTSHAAIVSRELGIPCVIGTKIATKIFKDGDLVEVDANRGVVRKI
ncbi:MAG: hypothetical protein HYV42_02885 [Candidatus Magasanikbacteria bacterium]|nr:hypothetical protein [Candidatus Magasanikbacteria bacterium]